MKPKIHLEIGKEILKETDNKYSGIYKTAYLFGCIAPDINYVYPLHNIIASENRYGKILKRICTTHTKLIKSFKLGTLTHYTCDYFCIAHNNRSYGAKHRLYEIKMKSLLKKNKLNIGDNSNNIDGSIQEIIKDNNFGILNSKRCSYWSMCKNILGFVKCLNSTYKSEYIENASSWYKNGRQMQTDIDWGFLVSKRLIGILGT